MSSAAALLSQLVSSTLDTTGRALALVVDDISMTPNVTRGFPSEREAPIFMKVFWRSLRTKILFLLPIGLALNALAPQAITPLLGLGGIYLAFEGATALLRKFAGADGEENTKEEHSDQRSLEERENDRVEAVAKTDIVLSSEIMAVSLSTLPDEGLIEQSLTLIFVAIFITFVVYGSGLLIVKSDDFGARLRDNAQSRFGQFMGRLVLTLVPKLLVVLSWVGGFAMLWVAGQLMIEALVALGATGLEDLVNQFADATESGAPFWGGFFGAFANAMCDAIFGLCVGIVVVLFIRLIVKPIWRVLRGQQAKT